MPELIDAGYLQEHTPVHAVMYLRGTTEERAMWIAAARGWQAAKQQALDEAEE